MKRDRLSLSSEEKERLFCTELVNHYIPYEQARTVAKILATEKTEDELMPEEIQLIEEVCRIWFEQRQRRKLLSEMVSKPMSKGEAIDPKSLNSRYK